jgi:hypothetical protein
VTATFDALFHKEAARVRRVMLLRRGLAGLGFGLLAGGAGAAAAWYLREDALRPLVGAVVAGLGALAGVWVAQRRRLSDGELALYLDQKLESEEAITTAFEIAASKDAEPEVQSALKERATSILREADPKRVRPGFFAWQHAAVPLGVGAVLLFALLPLPPAPPVPPPAPGTELLKEADVPELERLENLANMPARDDAQRARLDKLADDAKKLREKLRQGAPRREVQAEMSRIDDALAAEKLSLGEGEERKGLESAMNKLAESPDLDRARKALGDRDLVEFDKEMQRLANSLEKKDRQRAKQTLEDAAEAAEREGAKDVAKMLKEEKKLLEQREKEAEATKDLADQLQKSLPDQAKQDLEAAKNGDAAAQKRVADQLAKALADMPEEDRKKLADNLKKQIEQAKKDGATKDGPPPDTKSLEELAKKLETEEGKKELQKQLEEMAKAEPQQGSEAERQEKLEQAQRDLQSAKDRLGGTPPPGGSPSGAPSGGKPGGKPGDKPGQKPGPNGNGANGKDPTDPNGMNGGGNGPGKNPKGPGTATPKVDAKDFRARADSDVNAGTPMPGVNMGRTRARPGETANAQGTGALGAVGPDEVNGVSRSDVPEEYREQVGRYFQP